MEHIRRSQWPRVLRCRSTAARLLRLWVRIPSGAWMFVCCECCVLSGRGLHDALIMRLEESYRLWCFVVCDLETSRTMRPRPALGRSATGGKNIEMHNYVVIQDTQLINAVYLLSSHRLLYEYIPVHLLNARRN